MTISVNGHRAGLLDFARLAWENALRRRQKRPTMPSVYHPNRTQRTIQRAYEDALYVCALWVAGLSISKHQLHEQGLSVARWYYARALLDMARLIDRGRRDRLNTTDEIVLRNRLETALGRARAQPELFFARLPPHVRRKNERKF
jgi:hypothetical protein